MISFEDMRIFFISILIIFLGQLTFYCALSLVDQEDEIVLNAEESEDGESEENTKFENEPTSLICSHGKLDFYINIGYSSEKELMNEFQVNGYPKICVAIPYSPPDRNV